MQFLLRIPKPVLGAELQAAHEGPVRPEGGIGAVPESPRVTIAKWNVVQVRHTRVYLDIGVLVHDLASSIVVHKRCVAVVPAVDVKPDRRPRCNSDGMDRKARVGSKTRRMRRVVDAGPRVLSGLHGMEP